jgi:hypothetical protein
LQFGGNCDFLAGCRGHAVLAGFPPRHNHGRLTHNQDDGAVALARPARMGCINQCEGLLRIIAIRARELNGERKTTTVTNQMSLAAELRPISGIGTRLLPLVRSKA